MVTKIKSDSPLTKEMLELFHVAKEHGYDWSDISDITEQGRVISFRDKVYHSLAVTVLLTPKYHKKDEFIIRAVYGLDDRPPIQRVTAGNSSHVVRRFNDFESIFDMLAIKAQQSII